MICISLLLFASCRNSNSIIKVETNEDIENLKFTAEEAPDWTALFNRTSGWFGADGIFALPLNGKDNETAESGTETMLIFSDTMIGEIEGNKLQPGQSMVNNSVAYIKGVDPKADNISFHWAKIISPIMPKPIPIYLLPESFLSVTM